MAANKTGRRFVGMPPMIVQMVEEKKKGGYQCPIYARASLTGAFVRTVRLESSEDESVWALQCTRLLLEKDE